MSRYKNHVGLPFLQVRSTRKRAPHDCVFVIEELYVREYKGDARYNEGTRRIRVSDQVWMNGTARRDDYELASAQVIWPNLIVESKTPVVPEDDQ
jgi:hypothetical protein